MARKPAKTTAASKKTSKVKAAETQITVFESTGSRSETIEIHQFATEPAKVHLYNSLTKSDGAYQGGKYGVSVTIPCYVEEMDQAMEDAHALMDRYMANAGEAFNALASTELADTIGDEVEEDEAEEDEAEEDEAEEDEAEEDDEITEDAILEMSHKELKEVIEENELEIDLNEYKKTAKGLKELRAAVIEYLEEDEEEDEEDDEITEDAILEMSHKELIALCEDEELETDPDDFKKSSKGTAKFAKAIIAELSEDDEAEEDEAEEDEAEDEAEDEDQPYTKKELEKMPTADLKKLFSGWDLGKFPKGAEKVQRKKAIATILEAQDED